VPCFPVMSKLQACNLKVDSFQKKPYFHSAAGRTYVKVESGRDQKLDRKDDS
jgi:hypothetical protein